jgi:hypothetical protein
LFQIIRNLKLVAVRSQLTTDPFSSLEVLESFVLRS